MNKFDDNSIMPFGEHKGKKMINVPDSYLMFIYSQSWISKWPQLEEYIKDNYEAIKNNTNLGK